MMPMAAENCLAAVVAIIVPMVVETTLATVPPVVAIITRLGITTTRVIPLSRMQVSLYLPTIRNRVIRVR